MSHKDFAVSVLDALETAYPDAVCSLVAKEPWQLLCAVRLSAQCTDARVNLVTKELFEAFPTLDSLANAPIEKVEDIVRPCGLFKVKAQNLKDCCQMIRDKFNGVVPDNMEDLLTLPGVGRKTANLILGDVYGKPAVVCDTHCIRICNRLGFISTTDPYKAELGLKEILPPDRSNDFCHRLVLFGREYCTARNPKCNSCPLATLCTYHMDY